MPAGLFASYNITININLKNKYTRESIHGPVLLNTKHQEPVRIIDKGKNITKTMFKQKREYF